MLQHPSMWMRQSNNKEVIFLRRSCKRPLINLFARQHTLVVAVAVAIAVVADLGAVLLLLGTSTVSSFSVAPSAGTRSALYKELQCSIRSTSNVISSSRTSSTYSSIHLHQGSDCDNTNHDNIIHDGGDDALQQILPPVARRDDNRFIYAGVLPVPVATLGESQPPRQSSSLMKADAAYTTTTTSFVQLLMDPPKPIPDPYGWMRDDNRQDPEVLEYIQQENEYAQAMTSHLEPLQQTLVNEYSSYSIPNDGREITSLPKSISISSSSDNHSSCCWWYYTKTLANKAYRIHCRSPSSSSSKEPPSNESLSSDVVVTTSKLTVVPQHNNIKNSEVILLDENKLAAESNHANNNSYFAIHSVVPSPFHEDLIAYSVDRIGDERYQMIILNTTNNGHDGHDAIVVYQDSNRFMSGSMVWANNDNNSTTLIYTLELDEATGRPNKVVSIDWTVAAATNNTSTPSCILEEPDPQFWLSMRPSRDGLYLLIEAASAESTETMFLSINQTDNDDDNDDKSNQQLTILAPRQSGLMYTVEHWNGHWIIVSNFNGTANSSSRCGGDWTLWTASVSNHTASTVADWNAVVVDKNDNGPLLLPSDASIDSAIPFANHIVIQGRQDGIPRIWILTLSLSNSSHAVTVHRVERLEFPDEPAHYVQTEKDGVNDYNSKMLLVSYQSLVTPPQTIEIDMDDPSNKRRVIKEQHVPNYEKELYECERVTVPSRDGKTNIPLSLVYRKDTLRRAAVNEEQKVGKTVVPIHLFGYGAYGHCMEAAFSPMRIPLLSRGIVFAIAHVRGGGELGRKEWYETAKYGGKHKSFDDFVDIARWLVKGGHDTFQTTPDLLSCEGRSAGGLLVAASINQEPELFRHAILGVPFLDVVCTMVDASLPLTQIEWNEWGNPNEHDAYHYMMNYDPIVNVKKNATYPSCLLIGGWNDPRVPYWDPLKWAATVRQKAGSSKGPLCVKIDMDAGHSWGSDRFVYYKEMAFIYSFVLDQLGLS